MKKLFSLLTLALLTLSLGATTVTFIPGTTVGNNTSAAGADAMTLDGVTISTTAGGLAAAEYRFAANSTTTISSTVGNITKVEFTCTASYGAKYGPHLFSGEGYTAQSGSPVGIWQGNDSSFTLTASAQVRCSQIVVTIADATSDELVAPVFHPAGGVITESTEVTLTCATPDAEIYYWEGTEDEQGTWIYYNAPFYVNETKTYTAVATKGSDMSEYVTVTFTKELPTVADPVFTPASGTTFEDDLAIRIDCETEGASIMYQVNDGDVKIDEAPVFITLTETSTVTAVASLDGYNNSQEVTATYTKVEPVTGPAIVFNHSDDVEMTAASQYTVEREGASFTVSNGMIAAESYRIYKNQTITFTSTAGNIIRIEFDGVSGKPVSNFGNVNGMTYDNPNGVWVGNASTVSFTAAQDQVRCSEIRVYVNGEVTPVITVANPVIAPANNTTFAESQVVTITCETEGAQIFYGFDNETFEAYNAPFTINDACTVYAYAQIDTVKSATVSAKYFKGTEVNNLQQANGLNKNDKFIYNGEATVTYQWKNESNGYISTWIKDATASGLIYGKQVPELAQGVVLNDGWDATKTEFNGIPEYTYPNNVAASSDVIDVTPAEYAALTTENVNEYVILKGQTIVADGDKNFHTGNGLAIYNQFGVTLPTFEDNKLYDVVGIATIYQNAAELYIISATEVGTIDIVEKPTLPEDATFTESITVEITNNEDGAIIMYSTDNGETWNEYTSALTFTETTTLQAKAVKDGVESLVVTATYTKVEPIVEVTYTLVTDDADLADGDKIILVNSNVAGDAYAMGAIRKNNFGVVDVTVEDDMTITTGTANVITLEANGDNWNLKTNDGYLYAASSTANHLMLEEEADANADAAITITADTTTIVFQGENTRNIMRFNINVHNDVADPIFSCYGPTSSVKTPVYVYKAAAAQTWELGDVNHSGGVDIEDVTALINAVLGNPTSEYYPEQANCNGDTGIDIEDVTALISRVLNGQW